MSHTIWWAITELFVFWGLTCDHMVFVAYLRWHVRAERENHNNNEQQFHFLNSGASVIWWPFVHVAARLTLTDCKVQTSALLKRGTTLRTKRNIIHNVPSCKHTLSPYFAQLTCSEIIILTWTFSPTDLFFTEDIFCISQKDKHRCKY